MWEILKQAMDDREKKTGKKYFKKYFGFWLYYADRSTFRAVLLKSIPVFLP